MARHILLEGAKDGIVERILRREPARPIRIELAVGVQESIKGVLKIRLKKWLPSSPVAQPEPSTDHISDLVEFRIASGADQAESLEDVLRFGRHPTNSQPNIVRRDVALH